MAVIPSALFLLIILGVIISLIVVSIRNGVSGIKLMLLGINITLFGGIIAVDPNSNLAGIEYLIAVTGLIISIVGSRKKD
ncbi:hypothetical protein [Orenia marismortui]|uniref:Uncharacterized protein n=1 Tax=Orenia marismortui TaxID=46469 RepID=A0A4R8GT28_9FIRM|nr:hypothetical protein [Orenia marismortui]TDX49158.1 hypothetical protein C7959_12052 [Orenia marismortui]